jgi:glycosyltransferase involved in cell wall biosynthesis
VYELDDTPAHAFIWPYLLHDGGVLRLRTLTLHDSRAAGLLREQRAHDYVAEFAFNHGPWPGRRRAVPPAYPGNWPMLRVPLLAARLVVVSHPSTAAALERAHPEARVRVAATGVQELQVPRHVRRTPVTFGAIPTDRLDPIRRAMARARQSGAAAELADDTSPERLLRDADVIVSLPRSPLGEPLGPALSAMAAGKPVIVLETATTADWPALDPQTWRPRGLSTAAPIAVSIDPRDEEHSLVLAIRRLSTDAALRAELGEAAHGWWRTHATPRHAAEDWERILAEAAPLGPLARPADWPGHLTADGTARARTILDECGVTVDFL